MNELYEEYKRWATAQARPVQTREEFEREQNAQAAAGLDRWLLDEGVAEDVAAQYDAYRARCRRDQAIYATPEAFQVTWDGARAAAERTSRDLLDKCTSADLCESSDETIYARYREACRASRTPAMAMSGFSPMLSRFRAKVMAPSVRAFLDTLSLKDRVAATPEGLIDPYHRWCQSMRRVRASTEVFRSEVRRAAQAATEQLHIQGMWEFLRQVPPGDLESRSTDGLYAEYRAFCDRMSYSPVTSDSLASGIQESLYRARWAEFDRAREEGYRKTRQAIENGMCPVCLKRPGKRENPFQGRKYGPCDECRAREEAFRKRQIENDPLLARLRGEAAYKAWMRRNEWG